MGKLKLYILGANIVEDFSGRILKENRSVGHQKGLLVRLAEGCSYSDRRLGIHSTFCENINYQLSKHHHLCFTNA